MTKSLQYISISFFLIFAQAGFSQTTILFSDIGLKFALKKAKTENRPVLLWCYATWCPHCKAMKAEVFTNQTVVDYFNKTFICVEQDMEKGEGIGLNKELKISSFPTFIFYDPDGTMVYRVEGELKSEAFIQEGKSALTPKKQLPYLKHQFEKDVSNSATCYEYVRALKKGGMDLSTVIKQYFATQSDKQLLSEVNWRIISNGVSDINSREMRFVINHQKEFSRITSPLRVKRKLDYLVKELLGPLVEANDTVNYLINRKLATEIHSYSTDSLIFNYDLKIWGLNKNWYAYSKICLRSTETYAWNNHTQLNDIAGNFLKNIPDTKALAAAIRWVQRSLALDPEYDTYLLCSKLYQKINNIPEAIRMAKKAKDLSAKYGWEGTEAEEKLKELNDLNK
ncbi:MAG: thioredoxin fold domain-containing protein [Bacteroidota bacterium]|nr:thioredoxin fold domain-containing protein [Bacteroidota bacterium]